MNVGLMGKPDKYAGWSRVGAARARKREAELEVERKALDAEPVLPAREDAITLGQEMLPIRRGPGKVERVSVDDLMLERLIERALTKPTILSVTVTRGYDGEHGLAGLLVRLIELSDVAVLEVLAIVMAETLEAGSASIEVLGPMLGTDLAKVWHPDDALLDLIKDREVLSAVLADVAGADVATANEAATGKVKRKIIRDCLTGENGRAKVTGWIPKWMAFPPAAYTERGGVGSVSRAAKVAALSAPRPEPQPMLQAA